MIQTLPLGRRLSSLVIQLVLLSAGLAEAMPSMPVEADTARESPTIRVRSIAKEGYILTRDGIHLYYEIAGTGEPTVVVSGGFLLRAALEALTQRHRVVFYDARGRGRSDSPQANQISLQHQVDDLEDVRRALGLERMVILAWSGMGKELAFYSLQHPERVEQLIQVDPIPPSGADWLDSMMATRMERVDEEALADFRARREAGEWTDDPEGYCRAEAEITRPMTFADPTSASAYPDVCGYPNEWPENLGHVFDALLPSVEAADARVGLAESGVSRLVIHGDQDAIPLDAVREWVDGYPNVCLVVIPESGHWPFIEGAETFFAAVDQFLAGKRPERAICPQSPTS